jgi:hypothetical protein
MRTTNRTGDFDLTELSCYCSTAPNRVRLVVLLMKEAGNCCFISTVPASGPELKQLERVLVLWCFERLLLWVLRAAFTWTIRCQKIIFSGDDVLRYLVVCAHLTSRVAGLTFPFQRHSTATPAFIVNKNAQVRKYFEQKPANRVSIKTVYTVIALVTQTSL